MLDMQLDEQENHAIGKKVVAKSSVRKMLERIELNDDESSPEELINELRTNGGKIVGTEGKTFLIETSNGSFYLPKFCVTMED
jgi:hypothetical protein